jgi:hypothetical protein
VRSWMLDRRVLEDLVELGPVLGAPAAPRAFLIWTNCD